jgi:cobalamin biosynthesis Mg chelatase CobN
MSEQTKEPAAPKPTVEELRAGIKQTRAELGETVQALAAKADVKARARDQVEQVKEKALGQVEQAKVRAREVATATPVPIALVVAGVAAVVGIILVVRGRRR